MPHAPGRPPARRPPSGRLGLGDDSARVARASRPPLGPAGARWPQCKTACWRGQHAARARLHTPRCGRVRTHHPAAHASQGRGPSNNAWPRSSSLLLSTRPRRQAARGAWRIPCARARAWSTRCKPAAQRASCCSIGQRARACARPAGHTVCSACAFRPRRPGTALPAPARAPTRAPPPTHGRAAASGGLRAHGQACAGRAGGGPRTRERAVPRLVGARARRA